MAVSPAMASPTAPGCPRWCTRTDHDLDWAPSATLHTTETVSNDELYVGSFTNEDGLDLQTVLTLHRPLDYRQEVIYLPADPDRLEVIGAGLLAHARQLRAAGLGSTPNRHGDAA